MWLLYLTLIPDVVIMMLLIFSKKFSKKYDIKSVLGSLLMFFITKILFIISNLKNLIEFGNFSLCFLALFYVFFPFGILYYCNIKRKKIINCIPLWIKILLILLLFLLLSTVYIMLLRIKF